MKSKQAIKRLSLPVLPAIMFAGGVSPVHALEIGTIDVQSNLGQPLRASIAYALAPNEAIADYCVSLAPISQLNGLPAVSRASVAVANGVITITGTTAISEPLLAARLQVNCPYTPKISREYMLFVDPAELPVDNRFAATRATPAGRNEPAARPQRQPQAPAASPLPIAIGASYRVQPGDSLSEIAARLEDRRTGLWQAVNAIFQANPGAFLNGDPNQLKAGVVLQIPGAVTLSGVAPGFPAASESPVAPEISDDTAYLAPAAPAASAAVSAAQVRELGGMTVDSNADPADAFAGISDAIAEPAVDLDPVAEAPTTTAPASQADVTVPAAAAPAVMKPGAEPDALPVAPAADASGSNAIWWTLGGALAVIGGLLFWRRRKTDEVDDVVAAVAARRPQPARHLEEDSIEVEIINLPEAAVALDYDLSDDSPTEENLALDADLFEGDGLVGAESTEQADFAFAPTTELDLELTEAAAREPEEAETDIIAPPRQSAGSILESEVLPEEHDYDMSVIMDVTKTPKPEEATMRDLKAIVVEGNADDGLVEEDAYTLSQEVDYQILEQDYEDEMTATQALNKEIERAARELTADLDDVVTVESETLSHEETTALPVANMAELEATANLPAGNDDDSTTIDTAQHHEITVNLDAGDKTVEMAASPGSSDADEERDDQTVEMDIHPTKADSRAG